MADNEQKHLHLVLGSGGVRCIAYIGAIQALVAHGYSFASVSGCSAGSLVAAMVCAGLTPETIEERVLNLDFSRFAGRKSLFGLGVFLKWPFALYSTSRFPDMVRELIGDDPKIKDLP